MLTALLLTACSGKSSDTPPPMPASADTCGVGALQTHIGEALDVTLMQFFEAAVPSHRVRVLKPDTVATDDAVPERANIKTDNSNIITAITCG
ncbi:MAG TPA: I78 family peptidase inhibitor [Dongiaceae bacterium]|nr:I78 family peptidase inhibitor [Dongiaceae bacterium]